MEILAVSCVHNDIENMFDLIDQVSKFDFDVVVFPGDFTDLKIPKGFTRVDVARVIVSQLETLGRPLVTVPGSWDKEIIDYLDEKGISAHGRGLKVGGVGFYGYGGARTPFGTPFEPADGEIELGLMKSYEDVKDEAIKIQVTHMPPLNTSVDMIASGAHVGSDAVRKFIEKRQPAVAISAHIHESKGLGEIGGTKLVNPGRFPEGNCAVVSVNQKGASARMIKLGEDIKTGA